MKTYKRKLLIFIVLCIVVMLSSCTDQLTVLEVENAWTEALTQGEVDYKKFCDPAKQAMLLLVKILLVLCHLSHVLLI